MYVSVTDVPSESENFMHSAGTRDPQNGQYASGVRSNMCMQRSCIRDKTIIRKGRRREMTLYSNTRLNQFDNCRYAYDLKYNRGVETPFETIEAFMGSRVHETLEKLYRDLEDDKLDTVPCLLEFYRRRWDECYHEYMIYNRDMSEDDYREMGADCIVAYYDRMKPFDQYHIAGIETDEVLDLPDGNTYSVRIDRLEFRDRVFRVCDYKTSGRMKSQWDADSDRQLAMYALWVHRKYGPGIRVKLVWHMLRFDQDVESDRNSFELQDQEQKVVDKIAEIEHCHEWPTNPSRLCDWCCSWHLCPEFRDADPEE